MAEWTYKFKTTFGESLYVEDGLDGELLSLDPEKSDEIKVKYNEENGTFIIWASEIPYKYMKDAKL